MSLATLRGRMPLVGFILLAILCIALFGFACACLSDHPMQALERALAAIPAVPALVEVWSLAAVLVAGTAGILLAVGRAANCRSPVTLQRLLL
jgi:hypothetical protein